MVCSYALNTESVPSFVNVFDDEPKSIYIKSTLNKWQCNNKEFIPIELSKNSKGIIYSVRAVKKSDFKTPQKMLLNEVKNLFLKKLAKIADYINPNGTNRSFNLYLMSGNENI